MWRLSAWWLVFLTLWINTLKQFEFFVLHNSSQSKPYLKLPWFTCRNNLLWRWRKISFTIFLVEVSYLYFGSFYFPKNFIFGQNLRNLDLICFSSMLNPIVYLCCGKVSRGHVRRLFESVRRRFSNRDRHRDIWAWHALKSNWCRPNWYYTRLNLGAPGNFLMRLHPVNRIWFIFFSLKI